MPSIQLLRRRDPWWEADGRAARRARRRQLFVSGLAFATAVAAVGFAAAAWAIELGVAGTFGFHASLGLG